MKCPQCRSEVADWHFYCTNCQALINDLSPDARRTAEGMAERAGRRMLNLLFGVFIIGLLILMARAIEWKNLLRTFQGDVSSPAETRGKRNERTNPPSRGSDNSNQNANEAGGRDSNGKNRKAESVRSVSRTIEELPSLENSPSSRRINPQVDSTKTGNHTSTTSPESKSTPKPTPSRPIGQLD